MEWAEEYGVGEMGLMPAQFWSLNVHEFWIKFRAFSRAEDRAEARMIRQALRTVSYKADGQRSLERAANALKRYPMKKWLAPE